jgi:hypothetical protein
MPMIDEWPNSPYTILIARAHAGGYCRVSSVHALKRLPIVSIPLAQPDPDVPLDLQPLIQAIYEQSKYAWNIDYRKMLKPPLTREESDWLKNQLRRRKGNSGH